MAPSERESQQIVRQFDQIGDFVAAVALVARVELFGFEVLAERRFDDFTGEELFDESGADGSSSRDWRTAVAYLRSMRATVWRRWASCSVIFIVRSSFLRRRLFHTRTFCASSVFFSGLFALLLAAHLAIRGFCGKEKPAARGGAADEARQRALPRHLVRQAAAGAGGVSVVGRADRRRYCAWRARFTRFCPACWRMRWRPVGGRQREGYWAAGLLGILSDIRYAFGGVAAGGGFVAAGSRIWRRCCWRRGSSSSGAESRRASDFCSMRKACSCWRRARCSRGRPWSRCWRVRRAESAALGWLAGTGALDPVYRSGVAMAGAVCGESGGGGPGAGTAWCEQLNWLGFHVVLVIGARCVVWREDAEWKFLAWAHDSAMPAWSLGWRFFPRYYFLLLPALAIPAARGLTLMRSRAVLAIALAAMIVPLSGSVRATPMLANWNDLAMDRDSREASRDRARGSPRRVDSTYGGTGRRCTSIQDCGRRRDIWRARRMTGVPADRHLTQSDRADGGDARGARGTGAFAARCLDRRPEPVQSGALDGSLRELRPGCGIAAR